ncbi:hypothetical protein [Cellulomonas aerilata]|uniref:Uncharacterized protein n=1 Tax=Cellulomonas aerilata TaxID=515326 RepID=A0A512DF67_9CELL|nr:hypothetical protein [Cellulomonas aerilata]GEO34870.1 hypothetical protein CAE01nite_25950 [Cellulomonas aerilata]
MDIDTRPRPLPTHRPHHHPRTVAAAAAWSAGCAALALWWLVRPGDYVLDDGISPTPSSPLALVEPRPAAAALLVLGLLGVPLAIALGRLRAGDRARGPLLAAGGVVTIVLGVLVPDVQLLSFLGYAMALAGPPVLVVLLAVGARRSPRNLLALAAVGAAITIGVLAGEIGSPTVEMLRGIRGGLERVGPRPLVLAVMLLGGVLFGALILAAARRGAAVGPIAPDPWQRRGRVATWVAAACPLPYVLVRMTWLTPWPLGAPGGVEALDGGIRVFGLLLGLAALGGSVLTVGLISRWGEVFPRWIPGLRGRPVPVAAAVVPAGIVSAVLCAASVSLVMMSLQGSPWLVLLIPAPVWGPALGIAALAYHRRRTAGAPGPASAADPLAAR